MEKTTYLYELWKVDSSTYSAGQLQDNPAFWSAATADGTTLADDLKLRVLQKVQIYLYMQQHAKNQGYSLSADQKKTIEQEFNKNILSFGTKGAFNEYMAQYGVNYDQIILYNELQSLAYQGNELLFLSYLKASGKLNNVVISLIETYSLVNMLYSVMAGMTIDTFERAIYLDNYTGTNSETIMEDGTITFDEYNLLYTSICTDYGVEDSIDGYWQHGMTITSPCYYISYSLSALSVLQVYEMANTNGFDVAKDAYLKLFTYVDEDPAMTIEEILAYAGMLSYDNEQLYINLNKYFLKK
jgi:hypothetical protein